MSDSSDPSKIRVLVVDDEEGLRRRLSRVLVRAGYPCELAGDVAEARALLDEFDPHLILCDVDMPGESGLEFLAWLSQHRADIGTVMVSGYDTPQIASEALQLGAYGYIAKPFERNEVLIGLASAARRRMLEMENRRYREHLEKVVDDRTSELQRAQRRAEALVANSFDIFVVLDADLRVTYASPALERVLARDPAEVVGADVLSLIHAEDRSEASQVLAAGPGEPGRRRFEVRMGRADGGLRWCEIVADHRVDDEAVGGIVLSIRDVQERREREEMLHHQARYDQLTGLPNRWELLEQLRSALDDPESGSQTAVLFLDLDRLKVVNDSLGHETGDEILLSLAERLRSTVRPGDVVSRFGGDEFVIVCRNLPTAAAAAELAERVLEAMRQPLKVKERSIHLSGSIGVAVVEGDRPSADALLRDADAAMYEAKADGRDRVRVFSSVTRERALRRLDIEHDLRAAVDDGRLIVHYQPQVESEHRRTVGIEALVRWSDPVRGLLPPAEFLEVAEETGLILQIGGVVLATACRDLARLDRDLGPDAPERVSVNVAAAQLQRPDFVDDVERALADAGLRPDRLCVEVTESTVIQNIGAATDALRRLKEQGVSVSIDDFGTGFSNLAYLAQFPADEMKIDRSFVLGMAQSRDLVDGIVKLAKSLGLRVVAEGVETSQQLADVLAVGCDLVQGYLTGRPVPLESLFRDEAQQRRAEAVPSLR